jgi:hypothetical protein
MPGLPRRRPISNSLPLAGWVEFQWLGNPATLSGNVRADEVTTWPQLRDRPPQHQADRCRGSAGAGIELLRTVGVQIVGAFALVYPRLASIGDLWLGFTMFCAVVANLAVLHTSPVPAIVLGLLNGLIVYLRRDELA